MFFAESIQILNCFFQNILTVFLKLKINLTKSVFIHCHKSFSLLKKKIILYLFLFLTKKIIGKLVAIKHLGFNFFFNKENNAINLHIIRFMFSELLHYLFIFFVK